MNTEKLDTLLDGWQEEMTQLLQELVRIPSVKGKPKENAPYGEDCAKILEVALHKAQELGFATDRAGFYAGHAEYGQGNEVLALASHLDVVPASDGWSHSPFAGEIRENCLYGRGTTDNKHAFVACLYAMRAVKEAGIPLQKRVRLIFGCSEETGSKDDKPDMVHYLEKFGMPDFTLVPDGFFPYCSAEKGMQRHTLRAEITGEHPLLSLHAGEAVNIVPPACKATLKGTAAEAERLNAYAREKGLDFTAEYENGILSCVAKGIPAPGAMPYDGKSAVTEMLNVLSAMDLGAAEQPIGFLRTYFCQQQWNGEKLGVACADELTGPFTVNLGILRFDGKILEVRLDTRLPGCANGDKIEGLLWKKARENGFSVISGKRISPVLAKQDSYEVQVLKSAYRDVTGREDETYSTGGTSYTKFFSPALLAGPTFQGGRSGVAHSIDEHIALDEFYAAAKIYARVICALAAQ